MKRILLLFALLFINFAILQAQEFSLDDSTTVFQDKGGNQLSKKEVQEIMKGKFDMKTENLADGRKLVTIFPFHDAEKEIMKKLVEDYRKAFIGKSLADFQFEDINGNKLNKKQLLGKVIVINFWFTSCKPCIAEMPLLNGLVAAYKDKDVVFIAPALDKDGAITKFLQKFKFDYQIIANQVKYADKLKVENFPTHIVTDKQGIIKQVEIGYNDGIKEILGKTIEELL
jgi:thiol-disulfide isomerase/thioredoxin